MISYRQAQRKKKATNCTRFGHSLWSAIKLPAQVVHVESSLFDFRGGARIVFTFVSREKEREREPPVLLSNDTSSERIGARITRRGINYDGAIARLMD